MSMLKSLINFLPMKFLFCFLTILLLASCTDEITEQLINTNTINSPEYIYELETIVLEENGANKPNQKTLTEFASIAYTDLFNTTISSNLLNQLLSFLPSEN